MRLRAFTSCTVAGCKCGTQPIELAHPEDAVPARTSPYHTNPLRFARVHYPAAERLERAIRNAEVD